ncbi:hypothetical protein Lepto7376_4036 [[Leptolyngbya] sp. PCC 7376]|uniref:hypothetical protein n=1 Tax=[Leptolyngbya] sp. PCC 7376 TaxID=111781 RepID=UPI00029ED656|nr:hypothetical protein [[Leptolyngbya] sp. PCC 7376]AFY40171.1 hypothetical protein Lepto7376_4036 [[Leptolyngbya] sp. PCC 7376]
MSSPPTSQNPFLGIFCIVLGFFPIAASTGILKTDPSTIHAPLWVLFACGMVFVTTGLMMIFGQKYPWFNHLCAVLWFVTMGSVAGWVAFFAEGGSCSVFIPFFPPAWEMLLCKSFVAFGALFCAGLAIYAFRQFLKSLD